MSLGLKPARFDPMVGQTKGKKFMVSVIGDKLRL